MISSSPCAVTRRPPSVRRRALTAALSAVLLARSKRSCAAVASLLTFCPPGPEERTNDSVSSWSGITTSAAIGSGTASVRRPVHPRRRQRRGGRGRQTRRARLEVARLLLRYGDAHAVHAEDAPDRAVDIGTHVVHAVHGVGDPEAHFHPHAVVVEADEA